MVVAGYVSVSDHHSYFLSDELCDILGQISLVVLQKDSFVSYEILSLIESVCYVLKLDF
jgi:hypothetical protein